MGGAQGMQDMLSRQFQGFATNSGFMATNKTSKAYKGFQQGRWWNMENQDVERIRNSVPGIDVVTATIAQWGVNIVRAGIHAVGNPERTLSGIRQDRRTDYPYGTFAERNRHTRPPEGVRHR